MNAPPPCPQEDQTALAPPISQTVQSRYNREEPGPVQSRYTRSELGALQSRYTRVERGAPNSGLRNEAEKARRTCTQDFSKRKCFDMEDVFVAEMVDSCTIPDR